MKLARSSLLAKGIGKSVIRPCSMAAILFGAAGRIDWPAAWLFTALFLCFHTISGAWMFRNAPDLVEERGTKAANVPRWDILILRSCTILLPALFVTAGLDAGRLRWSHVPATLQVAAGAGVIAAGTVISWCIMVNRFLSSRARIQADRGQQVVQHGPYRYVRHPMYAAIIVLVTCIATALGSWLALIPAVLIGALFVIRTSLEDRMLRAELSGYREYAQRVPHRLLPGVW